MDIQKVDISRRNGESKVEVSKRIDPSERVKRVEQRIEKEEKKRLQQDIIDNLLSSTQFFNGFQFPGAEVQSQTSCIVSHSGKQGFCQRFSQCRSAQQYLSSIRPTICYFDQTEPVVCCDRSATATVRLKKPSRQQRKRVSQRKCEETYRKVTRFVPTIVGGVAAKIGEFSHAAAIGWYGRGKQINYNCGGFLVSPDFVLTAAHCTQQRNVAPNIIRIGGGDLQVARTTDAIVGISQIIVHPLYRNGQAYNDIAILRLAQRVLQHVPVCLWNGKIANNAEVIAIGYGHTDFSGPKSSKLLKTSLRIFPISACSPYYQTDQYFPYGVVNSQLCVGDPAKMRDTCQGDSGGPIIIDRRTANGRVPYVVGITSVGQGCAGQAPGIYTKIQSYLDWIESIVWPNGQ